MLYVISAVLTRIASNSALNVFQKIITSEGTKSSVLNFYTYLGLSVLSLFLMPFFEFTFSFQLVLNFMIMGVLGAMGNYYIIKSLSLGELSALAPINSYKPVVALFIAFIYLKEIPSVISASGIFLIIAGTYILQGVCKGNGIAVLYRVLALIFSGAEAVFIKKIILLTNLPTSFALWAFSGLIFSIFFVIPSLNNLKLSSIKNWIYLILSVALMQFSTNYVFMKINVAYALALFQLSAVLSVFLGVNVFHETNLKRKILASAIMLLGAVIIILN